MTSNFNRGLKHSKKYQEVTGFHDSEKGVRIEYFLIIRYSSEVTHNSSEGQDKIFSKHAYATIDQREQA